MDDENDLDNLFEEYENDNVTESTGEQQTEENANTEGNETETRQIVPVPKRIVRNPRLKFNADRLCGDRGIPVLTKHFKNVKYKGKGHEKEDLDKLMSTLEHWSHRLFPSMKFEACLKQIEKLGKKRAVQTCLVKIRRDMPILSSDFVHEEEEDERQEMQNEAESGPPDQSAFDTLFGESSTAAFNVTSTPTSTHSSGNALGTSFGGSLTEEQIKRMEYNKMLATERRKARMAAQQSSSTDGHARSSPSIIDLESSENTLNNKEASSVALNLDQQFDSLFGEASTSRNSNSILEDSDVNEHGLKTSQDNASEELGLDELMDLVDEEDSPNQNQPADGALFFDENSSGKAEAQDLDQQSESILENTNENGSNCEDLDENSHKNVSDFEDEDESLNMDFKKNISKSVDEDSVNDQCDNYFDKNDSKTLKEVSEEKQINSPSEKSGITQCESMNEVFTNNQSKSVSKENEELGLDELMDLVDE